MERSGTISKRMRGVRYVLASAVAAGAAVVLLAGGVPEASAATYSTAGHASHTVNCQGHAFHVYHYGTVNLEGVGAAYPIPLGTVHFSADVCADGNSVRITSNGGQPQCWTDPGRSDTAWEEWCGVTWTGNTMNLGANMRTAGFDSNLNTVETGSWLRDPISPTSVGDSSPRGGIYETYTPDVKFDMG